MVAVYSILATLSLIQLKMIGIGLAVAVLIDATVVRGILLPAALALLGDRSWYLPRWLGWLPGGRPALTAPAYPDPALAVPAQARCAESGGAAGPGGPTACSALSPPTRQSH